MKSTLFLLLSLCFQLLASLYAQDPASINYTTKDGLISNVIYHVMQDSKGYLWISTDKGVSKFNGTEFINFGLDEGLDGEDVFLTEEDDNGNIWIATHFPALYVIKDDQITPFWFNDEIKKNTKRKRVITSLMVKNDSVIIGFQYDGLLIFDRQGQTSNETKFEGKVVKKFKNRLVNYSLRSRKENIVSTPLVTFQDKNEITILNHSEEFEKGYKGPSLYSVQLSENRILIANYNILYLLKEAEYTIQRFKEPIDCLHKINEKSLMIGFLGGGVYFFQNIEKADCFQNFFKGESITSIIQDKNNGFWFSTRGKGLKYVPDLDLVQVKGPKKKVSEIQKLKDKIFTGYFDGSIIEINTNELTSKLLVSLKLERSDSPQYFTIDTAGNIYSELIEPSEYNFYCDNFISLEQKKSNGYVRELLISRDDVLWLGTQSNVYRVEKDSFILVNCEDVNSQKVNITCNVLFELNDKELWAGTNLGIFKFNGKIMVQFDKIPKVEIIDMFAFRNFLVVVSKFNGVFLLRGNQVHSSPELKSIVSINDSKVYKNQMFFIDDKNIIKVEFRNNSLTYNKYLFPFHEVDLTKISFANDQIFIGTTDGLFVCQMDRLENFKEPRTKIIINEVYFNEKKEIIRGDHIYSNSFSFMEIIYDRIALNTHGEIKIREIWSDRSNDFVSANSGKFFINKKAKKLESLQIVCQSNLSDEIVTSMMLKFENMKYSNMNSIFLFLLSSVLLAIGITGFQYEFNKRVVNLFKFNSRSKEINYLKLQALFAKMNPHFTFNVLNSIQGYILTEEKFKTVQFLNKYSRLLRKVLINSNQAETSLNEELELVKRYIEIENVRFNQKISFSINYHNDIDPDKILIPSMILQPVIENSIKHGFMSNTRDNYSIEVSVLKSSRYIEICIVDNGSGLSAKNTDASTYYKSVGLDIVKERLSIFNGNVDIKKLFGLRNLYKDNVVVGVETIMKFPL